MIHLIEYGLPKEQKGIFYFYIVQFHEDLGSDVIVYSVIPAILMWYSPTIPARIVYGITRLIDYHRRSDYNFTRRMRFSLPLYLVSFYFFAAAVNFQGATSLFEPIFGVASRWPAALLPIFPGMFLRFIHERPNSVNEFVPENRQGVLMAVFVRACTAVLPTPLQWGLWCIYTNPSLEYPSVFIEWLFCTFSWINSEASPLGVYAVWFLVFQYRHTYTWFRHFGGRPSVILQRERRGTLWYIATMLLIQLIENEVGEAIVESEVLTLRPQVWIPLALVFVIGIYLLKYGLLLRIYRYKHKKLQKGENIRLLRLRAQPCLPNSPIQYDIIHTALRRPPQHIAVSHRWGPVGAP